MGAVGAAVIGAAGTLLAAGGNMYGTSRLNRKTIKYNKEMYQLQRAHALQDWTMQNEYNSPASEIARLRAAGINPRLMYKGGPGESSAGPIRSTEAKGLSLQNVDYASAGEGIARSVMGFYDARLKQAQIDNLQAQKNVTQQDALLREAQITATNAGTAKMVADTDTSKFDLSQKERLKDYSAEALMESVRKTATETDILKRSDERAAAQSSSSLMEAAERILKIRQDRETDLVQREHIRQQIENLRKDATIKELDINLKKRGVQPGDAIYWRALAQALGKSEIQIDPKKWWTEDDRKKWMEKYAPKSGYSEWKKKFGSIRK